MSSHLFKGTLFALAACFIWGLIFVVPLFMEDFTPIEIAMGRYVTYGTVSLMILLKVYLQGGCRYPLAIWIKSLGFSLSVSVGYYLFVILSLRYSTAAICTLILGISPITIAFYGNWKEKECSYKVLILPSLLILVGLVVINVPHIMESTSPSTYLVGLFSAVWALISWSWYVVANSAFLKKNPQVDPWDWSTLIGVGTMVWVAIVGIFAVFFLKTN